MRKFIFRFRSFFLLLNLEMLDIKTSEGMCQWLPSFQFFGGRKKDMKIKLKIIKILQKLIELYQELLAKKREIDYIIIHHTATARDYTTFEAINREHQRRWKGKSKSQLAMYCGYQYLITGDGKIHQARLDTEQGWHCNEHNFNTIGIALTGNFMREKISSAQIISLEELLAEKLKQYNLDKKQIKGHKEMLGSKTLCPGEYLFQWLNKYRNQYVS